jgi:hypothetical protein
VTIDGEALTGTPYRRYWQEAFDEDSVTIVNTGNQPTEVKVSVTGIPAVPPPAGGNGFTISRAYYLPDGTPVEDMSAGQQNDRFVVVLTLGTTTQGSGQYVVADPLPGGFEIENSDLTQGAGLADLSWLRVDTAQHVEARTDQFVAAFRYVNDYKKFTTAYMVRAVSPGTSCCRAPRSRTCTGRSCAPTPTPAGSRSRLAAGPVSTAHTGRRGPPHFVAGDDDRGGGGARPHGPRRHQLRAGGRPRHRGGGCPQRPMRDAAGLDRGGRSQRAVAAPFTTADGRWRLPVTAAEVDKRFIDMLVAYEDQNFSTHKGIDWGAMLRASGQYLTAGGPHRFGRLDAHHAGGAADRRRADAQPLRQAPPDRPRRRAGTAAEQGRDPRSLSHARALWRQYRGRPRRKPRLFRQGAGAADDGRSGAAGCSAAIARGAPSRPRPEGRRSLPATWCSTAW